MSQWVKAEKSNADAACVEVRFTGDAVRVRDSKDRKGPELKFTVQEWEAFVHGVKRDEFDLERLSGRYGVADS